MKFALVAAVDKDFGLGKNNTLPWNLPSDLKHFASVTLEEKKPGLRNVVIMGRNTWESLPAKSRPLKNRINLVLSRGGSAKVPPEVITATSLADAFLKLQTIQNLGYLFIIGGGKVFDEAIRHPDCAKVYLTEILNSSFACDAFFPKNFLMEKFKITSEGPEEEENGLKFIYRTYEKA